MPLEAVSEEDWLPFDADRDKKFDWLNDVANLRHYAFATSASSDKTAFAFHFWFKHKLFIHMNSTYIYTFTITIQRRKGFRKKAIGLYKSVSLIS